MQLFAKAQERYNNQVCCELGVLFIQLLSWVSCSFTYTVWYGMVDLSVLSGLDWFTYPFTVFLGALFIYNNLIIIIYYLYSARIIKQMLSRALQYK